MMAATLSDRPHKQGGDGMKIHGIDIDVQKIAEGMYDDIFSDEDRAICAFGMLPALKMQSVEQMLGEKVEEMAKEAMKKAFGFTPERNCAKQDVKKRFVSESLRHLSSAIYGVASARGKMLV